MHWVNRGPEPSRLEAIRDRYTSCWIDFYENGTGNRPTDSRWRDFRVDLGQRFHLQCGYCETICRGQVDHFRPKSAFPGLVYEWSNWIFSCSDCNQAKSAKWPEGGYVDPCAASESCRPENYFTFDTETGEIVPLDDLDQARNEKAMTMIDDLNLNGEQHMKRRGRLLKALAAIMPDDPRDETPTVGRWRRIISSRDSDSSSLARAWLAERGYSISD